MLISKKWLSDYVKIELSPRNFSDRMASVGFEVDGYTSPGEGCEGVVIGRLVKIDRHPTIEKYFVCTLDVGDGRLLQQVTAAKNLVEGGLCPVVLPGGRLSGGPEIGDAEFDGVRSQGMMCSLPELGLSKADHPHAIEEGIFFLNEQETPCEVGQDALAVLGLDDLIYDFSITANRPDGHSVMGVAREVCAALDQPYRPHLPQVKGGGGRVEELLSVRVEAPELCPRYTARAVKNVKIGPSPKWLRDRVRAAGMRPINNLVDITNYVMMEYGQPMHAFDLRELADSGEHAQIVVRQAGEQDQTFVTLDRQERTLSPEMLMICNAREPVGLAGIMGGLQSGIREDTTTIVFESANFNGPALRRSGRKLGLRTDALARYEKGLDAQMTAEAVDRACELCELLGCAEVLDGRIDIDHTDYRVHSIQLDCDRINKICGTDIPRAQMVSYLERLQFCVEDDLVYCPSYRADMEGIADLAEEVVRLYGLDNVPSALHRGVTPQGRYSPEQRFERSLVQAMLGFGFFESVTYTFYSPRAFDQIRLPEDDLRRRAVVIRNPLGEDTSIMRTTPLPSMLQVLSANHNYRNEQARLFELAKIFLPADNEEDLPEERPQLTLGTYGAGDFYALKGVVEALCKALHLTPPTFHREAGQPTFHPGRCASIRMAGQEVGVIGEVHPAVLQNYGLDRPALLATLDIGKLFENRLPAPRYTPLPRYPATTRDLALVCDEDLPAAEAEAVLREVCGELLEQLELFDVYRGDSLPQGKKSLAYALTLRDRETTLNDARVSALIDEALALLQQRHGITLRS
ncbi:MAG: phenylalanine--tRNA ligase subunit beta [Clostridiales bacterium]|nr:phenylalanine--tRNA ligase subunit beta [Clostridiales bacterium]